MVEGTAQRLDELQRLADEATPGPWKLTDEHEDVPGASPALFVSQMDDNDTWLTDIAPMDFGNGHNDALFIAAAREAVPWLIGLVRGQADALQAATDERAKSEREWQKAANGVEAARRRAETALQRVRELRDEWMDESRGTVAHVAGVRLDAALGVGVPTECGECSHPLAAHLNGGCRICPCRRPGPLLPVPENPTTETEQ